MLQVARQGGAVVVSFAPPHRVVHAQAMDEHEQLRAHAGSAAASDAGSSRSTRPRLRSDISMASRIAGAGQPVAQNAVEGGHECLALGRDRRRRAGQPGRGGAEQRFDAGTDQARHAAHAVIHEARHAGARRSLADGRPGQRWRDLAMHGLDDIGDAHRRIACQRDGAAQVAAAQHVAARRAPGGHGAVQAGRGCCGTPR